MISPERKMLLAGPADAARRLGVSVKALRLYEQRGLVTPKRTRQGWRYFNADDLERLSRALAFKAMGFGLSQIAILLDAGGDDVAAAMAAQEAQLRLQRAATDDALDALRRARRQLATTGLRLVA
jgi:DNA-binding transcriptional MerR regulator